MNKRTVGTEYETVACDFLRNQGYHILERNYRNHFGEIDIIAEDTMNKTLVFCEVKFRSLVAYGDPLEAVDRSKQKRICKTAMYYYTYHGYEEDRACRFDVLAIHGDGRIEHIENAFLFQG